MKIKKIIVSVLVVVLFSGCAYPGDNSTPPTPAGVQYTTEDLFETTAKEAITLQGESTEPQQETEIPEYLKIQENIDYVKYDATNRCTWPDDMMNLRSMFCIDPDTGVSYFINQNKDWYIYRLVDGKAELAVALPARELYVLNGKVYFILEDYDKYEFDELTEGDIYACTLVDGTIEKVFSSNSLDNEIYRIRVYEDGIAIYCRAIIEVSPRIIIFANKEIESNTQLEHFYYFYTFADGVLEEDSYKRALPGWGDYYVEVDYAEWQAFLRSRINQENDKLDISVLPRVAIVEDTMYSFGGGCCQMNNLLTGEQRIFDINELFRTLVPKHGADAIAAGYIAADYNVAIDGFTITKDGIWMLILQYLFFLNPETGEAMCYWPEGNNHLIRDLYTDGINLYGTYGSLLENDGTLVRICTEEIIDWYWLTDAPVLAVEHLTE